MATFAITTTQNIDELTGKAGGDTYNINGGTLNVDQDSRVGLNQTTSASWSACTLSATLGGTLNIDGRYVRLIPYDSGTGNVPAWNTTISQGSASGKLIGVYSSLTVASTATGAAMPASGYIKIKQWNQTAYAAGALTGIGANATGADTVGWLEIVGDEAGTINGNRLGTVNITGAWLNIGTTSGASNQTMQIPSGGLLRYAAGVYIEQNAGQADYEFYPNAGTTTTTGTEADRGKCVWINNAGLVRIGNSGSATNGYTPASGLAVVVPNIFFENCTTAARTANVIPNATIASRFDFTCTGGGVVNADKCNFAWYPSFSQAYSVQLTNCCAVDGILLSECATAITWSKVGVGNKPTTALVMSGLTMSLCFAGGTLTDCVFAMVSQSSSGNHTATLTDIADFTFTRCTFRANTIRGNATTYSINGTRVVDCTWTDPVIIQGSMTFTTGNGITVTGTKYVDCVSGTTVTTYAMYVWSLLSNTINSTFSGLTLPVTGTQPYTALLSIGAAGCANIKLRSIGTRASPLSLSTGGNFTGLIYVLAGGAAATNIKIQQVYCSGTRTNIMTGDNSSTRVIEENVFGDYADAPLSAVLNLQRKGVGETPALTAQTSVYGTHWFDCFTSTTAGRIGLLMNEKTGLEPSASTYTITSGTTAFTSAGGLYMPVIGDQIEFTTPNYIIGHTSFQNQAAVMGGGTIGNYTLEYKIDKNDGNGYGGSWTTMTGANLSAISGINAALGFKMKWRITTGTTNSTAITSLYILTNSTTTAQDYQYPLDVTQVNIILTNIVIGSKYRIEKQSDSSMLFEGTAATSPLSLSYTHTADVAVDIIVRKSVDSEVDPKYIPFETQGTITNTGLSVFVAQVEDDISADATSGTIGTDFAVNTTYKTITHVTGSTVYTVNQLFTWLMNYFDEVSFLDKTIPMSAQTPTEYTLINGWFMDDTTMHYLKSGAIQTLGWASGVIRMKPYNATGAGTAFSATDIGKIITETDSGDTGTILFYDERTAAEIGYVWIRPDTTGDTFADADSAYTVATSSAAGVFTAASTSGETIWSNIFTLGSLVDGTTLDIYQNDLQITPWWLAGQIDILVKVKEAGTEIDNGNLIILARKYSTLYDHFVIDASSGRNPVPLAAFTDTNNQTIEGTVGAAPYTNITFSFGAKSRDLNNGNGTKPYDVEINCATLTMAQVYEYLKYVTRTGASTLNGVINEYYVAVGDIRFTYSGASGAFSETSAITDTTTGATGYIVSWINAGGNNGTLVVRNTHGTFANTNAISSGGTTATISSVPDPITPSKQAPFGTFAGGKFFGARGVWITSYAGSDGNNFSLIDSTGATQSPPNTIAITVAGVESGDSVSVFRTTGDNTTIDKSMYISHATANTSGLGTFTVTVAIASDTPSSGNLRVVDRSAAGKILSEQTYAYTSWTGSVFTLSGTLSQTYNSDDTCYVPFIDTTASGTSVSVNVSYYASRYVVTSVRKKGIVPFTVKGQVTSNGFSVTAIRTVDTIVS